jgi:hypothetical protein
MYNPIGTMSRLIVSRLETWNCILLAKLLLTRHLR